MAGINDLTEFPDTLSGCWIDKGFSNTAVKGKMYLGAIAKDDRRSYITATRLIESKVDLKDFLEWWVNDAVYGYQKIQVQLPFFGIEPVQVYSKNDVVVKRIGDERYTLDFVFELVETTENIAQQPPAPITDFNASDTYIGGVVVTWSETNGHPTYNLWRDGAEVATDIQSGYIDHVTGTYDYFVKAINIKGESDSNIDSGTGVVLPLAITDFTASDDEVEQITFTWTDDTTSIPTATYTIKLDDGSIVAENISGSPYVLTDEAYVGIKNYTIYAIAAGHEVQGNSDIGTFNIAPRAFTITASDDLPGAVKIERTDSYAYPEPEYDLYMDGTLVAANFVWNKWHPDVPDTLDHTFYVIARNAYGQYQSNDAVGHGVEVDFDAEVWMSSGMPFVPASPPADIWQKNGEASHWIVRVRKTCNRIQFVNNWDMADVTIKRMPDMADLSEMFDRNGLLRRIDGLDTTNAVARTNMFNECDSLVYPNRIMQKRFESSSGYKLNLALTYSDLANESTDRVFIDYEANGQLVVSHSGDVPEHEAINIPESGEPTWYVIHAPSSASTDYLRLEGDMASTASAIELRAYRGQQIKRLFEGQENQRFSWVKDLYVDKEFTLNGIADAEGMFMNMGIDNFDTEGLNDGLCNVPNLNGMFYNTTIYQPYVNLRNLALDNTEHVIEMFKETSIFLLDFAHRTTGVGSIAMNNMFRESDIVWLSQLNTTDKNSSDEIFPIMDTDMLHPNGSERSPLDGLGSGDSYIYPGPAPEIIKTTVITAVGTGTYIPSGTCDAIYVKLVGGGGSGCVPDSPASSGDHTGGASGEVNYVTVDNVNDTIVFQYEVGAGGVGETSTGSDGNDGDDTSFYDPVSGDTTIAGGGEKGRENDYTKDPERMEGQRVATRMAMVTDGNSVTSAGGITMYGGMGMYNDGTDAATGAASADATGGAGSGASDVASGKGGDGVIIIYEIRW